jgi:hypothetical protein
LLKGTWGFPAQGQQIDVRRHRIINKIKCRQS